MSAYASRKSRKVGLRLTALAAATMMSSAAMADTTTWDGSESALWNEALNWSLEAVPTGGDDVVFVTPVPDSGSNITVPTGGLANTLAFNDTYALTGGNLTLTTGTITVAADKTATITSLLIGSTNLSKEGSGTLVLGSANTFTVSATVNAGVVGIGNNAAFGNAANSLVINGGELYASGGARTVAQPYTLGGNFAVSGSQALTLSGASTLSAVRTITVTNSAATTLSGVLSGTGGITLGAGSTGTLVLNNASSTFAGGVTVNGGTLQISGSSDSPLTKGPLGTGTLTIANGATFANAGSASIANALVLSGGTIRVTNNGNLQLRGEWTIAGGVNTIDKATGTQSSQFCNTANPSSVTVTGNSTLNLVNNGGGTLNVGPFTGTWTLGAGLTFDGTVGTTISGVISGSGQTVTKNGTNTITLSNNSATASSYGSIVVNSGTLVLNRTDTTANTVGSIQINGGTLQFNNESALGSPSAITVNGGFLQYTTNAALINTKTIVVNSGGGLSHTTGSIWTIPIGTLTVPSAGTMNFGGSQQITIDGAYPSLTGDITFGGGGSKANTNAVTTLSSVADTARTITFNGGASTSYGFQFGGLLLNANLTVAGSGYGSLGAVTEDATPRSITVNMDAAGVVSITNGSAHTGGTFIKGGTLSVSNASGKAIGTGTPITLDGGTFRMVAGDNNTRTVTDNFTVTASGGTIQSYNNNANGPTYILSGQISGSGPVVLNYGGTSSNTSVLRLSGDNSASGSNYNGGFTVATTNARGGVRFDNANAMGGATNTITVPTGTLLAFGFAPSASDYAKVSWGANSIIGVDGNFAVDLSATGLNQDLRIGSATSITYTAAITPFGSAYKFTPGATLTLNTANQLTGANSLEVRAGPTPAGATQGHSGTLVLNKANDYTGGTTIAGPTLQTQISGSMGTGDITISSGLLLFGAAGQTQANNIVVNGGAFYSNDGIARDYVLSGNITLNAGLNMSPGNGQGGKGNFYLNGQISGSGSLTLSRGGSSGSFMNLYLNGDNSAWTNTLSTGSTGGGSSGHAVYVGHVNALGGGATPAVNLNGTSHALYFNTGLNGTIVKDFTVTSNASSQAFDNLSEGPGLGNGSGNFVRLAGNISGNGAPRIGGRASGDTAISELVLAGTNAWTGAPATVDYDPTAGTQNFVNGTGGLTMGPGASAKGFVRFEGDASLPGGGTAGPASARTIW